MRSVHVCYLLAYNLSYTSIPLQNSTLIVDCIYFGSRHNITLLILSHKMFLYIGRYYYCLQIISVLSYYGD